MVQSKAEGRGRLVVREEYKAGHGEIAGQKNLTKGEAEKMLVGITPPHLYFSQICTTENTPFLRIKVMSFKNYIDRYFTSHFHGFVCSSRKTTGGNVAKSVVYEGSMVSDAPQNGDA